MFQNYIFSFYGTLAEVKFDYEQAFLWEKLSVYYGIYDYHVDAMTLKEDFFSALKKEQDKNQDKEYFEPNFEDVLLRLFNTKKLKGKNKMPKDMGRFFHLLSATEMQLFPQVKKTLEALKKEDRQLFLLANAQKSFIKDELRYFGIKEYFDSLYVSSDYGMKKPSLSLFQHVILENKLEKKKTLFIGADFERDLLPAKELGFLTCLILRDTAAEQFADQADYVIEQGDLKRIIEL